MSGSGLSIGSIFRQHGSIWREAHRGHINLWQLKVMSAIERCRSAELGGHLWCCPNCARAHIAYNSCRNRHCPTCQAVASRRWLEARQAEILPVDYYRVVFTLPAPIADIAYPNKAVVYALLFRAAAQTLLRIARDPKRWKDYREQAARQNKAMTLSVDESIRRFLLHVLPCGFHRIRYYGLFANTVRCDNLTRTRAALSVYTQSTSAQDDEQASESSSVGALICPHCKTPMIIIAVIARYSAPRGPPPIQTVNK